MAVFTPGVLTAHADLEKEGIELPGNVCGNTPLRIALVNLMPLKEMTETDFLRILSAMPTDIELILVAPATHRSRNTAADYIAAHYIDPRAMLALQPDGVIITGAPVEKIAFEDVDYWRELSGMMDALASARIPTLYICWAALAGIYHFHGIDKQQYARKISGVFPHRAATTPADPILRGMDDVFYVPHSRYCGVSMSEAAESPSLVTVATGEGSGLYIARARDLPNYYVTGHSEYAPGTLDFEYHRDLDKGIDPDIPLNYYPDNNPDNRPEIKWRGQAHLLFVNWLGMVLAHRAYNNSYLK